ncbi:MAG: hypothetical protein CVU56_15780 [Deltaproteobacteria bacterium HGW-Deltaproteobacteria-14]|nr:MAG: hypothetical protein CVU56_15780 [Deltaproteobacteria bacterium HGW-Deltaproteobacteria-14]
MAALLREAWPDRPARALKAALVATVAPAWTEAIPLLGGNPAYGGRGERAPLTVAGAGRVNALAALETPVTAHAEPEVALDLGFQSASEPRSETRDIALHNDGDADIAYDIDFVFRDASDAQAGVRVTPAATTVTVPAGADATVAVEVVVDPRSLPLWPLLPTSFEAGWAGEPQRLTQAEYDGFVRFTPQGGGRPLAVPFYVLPRRAANGVASDVCLAPPDFDLRVNNTGLVRGQTELFTLVLTDPDEPSALDALDLRAVGVRLSVRGGRDVVQFAVATGDYDAAPGEAPIAVVLDVDEDGAADFVVTSVDGSTLGGGLPTGAGECLVLAPDGEGAVELPYGRFRVVSQAWTVADLVGSVRVLTAPLDALGLGAGANFDVWVYSPRAGAGPLMLVDAAPHHAATSPLEADVPVTVDTSCQLWSFYQDAVFYDETARVLLDVAPTCAAEGDGLLLVHLGNAPDGERGWEVLTPPTRADYACEREMTELADAETCTGTPDWTQFITGACDGAITATPVGNAFFPPGKSDARLNIVDYWGNETQCDTTVVIEDRTLPTIDCGDLTAVELAGGLLPVTHRVAATDACSAAAAEIVGWRCLVPDGSGNPYDVSSTCAVAMAGDEMTILELGDSATVLEWTVQATDTAGNQAQTVCAAQIDRDYLAVHGGGGFDCGATGGPGGGLWLLALGLGAWLLRRRSVSSHRSEVRPGR